MIDSSHLVHAQDEATARWHTANVPETPAAPGLLALLLGQHRANFELWHQEDAARDPNAPHRVIATVKRQIDTLNQQRNDLTEQIDLALLAEAGLQHNTAPLHSESPGLIVDRLSILALKVFHTGEEVTRPNATSAHRLRNTERLAVLQEQRNDLAACLDALWADVLAGRRRFKLYRQMKMYNDPTLNPVLYHRTPGV